MKTPHTPEIPEFRSTRDSRANCPEQPQDAVSPAMGTAPSGAMRECIGTKIDTSLVPPELTLLAAVGLNYGAEKYAPRNFEKGFRLSDLVNSIRRHTDALMCGERIDRDSGLPHEALIASSTAMLAFCYMQGRLDYDVPPRDDGSLIVENMSKFAQSLSDEGADRRKHNDNTKS